MAKKQIRILSIDNGWGLTKDIQLVKDILNNNYFNTEFEPWYAKQKLPYVDLQIHSEIVAGKLLQHADKNILLPNPEWMNPEWLPGRGRKQRFIATLCKTKHAMKIFEDLGMRNVIYTGFTTTDRFDGNDKKIPEFLHIAGNSRLKSTERIINIWNNHPNLPTLHLYNVYQDLTPIIKTGNIDYHFGKKPLVEIISAQNKYLYHIQPSETEGFGHILWESLSCGAVLLTLDAPPMNEVYSLKIKNPFRIKQHGFGMLYGFGEDTGYKCIESALNLTKREIANRQLQSRQFYLANNIQFRKKFYNTIKDIIHGKYK